MAGMTENLIRLRSVYGMGNAILWRLIRHFGDSDRILGAKTDDLTQVKGVTSDIAKRILQSATHDPRPELEKAVRADVTIIPYDDPDYPKPLLYSFDPPAILYMRGSLNRDDQVAAGIVGTRNASPYGRDNAIHMAEALARGGYTIVSGLARGVDTFAHIGALNAGGRTVGVLGCGFDYMYPEENRDLALEMTRSGAVITEFPMATPPSRETFPTRNRIIAGMVLGLLVIEAPLRSGSLITARLANEIGRTVFAIPGRVNDTRSEGCNKLIRDGATMVMTVDDIFNELNPSLPLPEPPAPDTRRGRKSRTEGDLFHARTDRPKTDPQSDAPKKKEPQRKKEHFVTPMEPPARAEPTPEGRTRAKLNADQEKVLAHISYEWRNIDDIIADSGIDSGKATAALALLKLTRLVDQGSGQTYRLR